MGWGGVERKISWIPWELICKAKALGGLDLGYIGWKNKALLIKWAWKYGVETECLWRKVIAAKYLLNSRNLLLHLVMSEAGNWSMMMRDIVGVLKEDTMITKGWKENVICRVGNGLNTRFWLDPWADLVPLYQRFPRIYAMNNQKTGTVADMGLFVRGKW